MLIANSTAFWDEIANSDPCRLCAVGFLIFMNQDAPMTRTGAGYRAPGHMTVLALAAENLGWRLFRFRFVIIHSFFFCFHLPVAHESVDIINHES